MAPENDMNEVFTVQFDDSDVITVPIDDTLANSGEAADAAAVGAALALKADKSELPATIKVNGQQADNQGLILVNGTHIPVNGDTQKTLAEAVEEITEMTADTIPMTSEQDAESIGDAIGGIKEDVSDLQEAIDGMETQTAASILMETGSTTTVKNAIETLDRKAVKSVNRKLPDAAGDVDLSVVPLAENLQSDKLQNIEGEFILRTTGGTGSVSDGKAYPQHIYGNSRHDGFVAEVLNLTVIPITRTEPDEPITATIDRDTFVAAVTEDSTINLYYTTEWSDDPADYGVTVTGDPVAGDQITIVYVKEVRGTIVVAEPDRLVGTGWNLYDANHEYARVVKYSDVYGYKVGGTYTSLTFSTTLTGERTSILPNVNGLFNVTSDGYVFVDGGNATDTYILATWSDWTNGPSTGYWEAYRESGIDLSAVVETYFPYGLLKVGTVRDEIDLVAKKSISRIERMVYSAENRAAAEASGREYDFDENNIYIVREEPVQNAITIGTDYSVSEHGLEWFTETELPLDTEILYGKNLRDKLERDVVTISAQTLTEEEKAQIRTNIGAMSQAEGDTKLVAPTAAGTTGQLLSLKADGGTEWTTQGTPTDTQVGTAVSAWLEAHPEATTTVEDGAISRAKLNADLQAKTDAVPELKSAITEETRNLYTGGNLTFTKNSGYVPIGHVLTPGKTYMFSADIVSSDTDRDFCRIYLCYGTTQTNQYWLINRGTRKAAYQLVTVPDIAHDCDAIFCYAGGTSSTSTGDTATFSNIQIEEGDAATDYIQALSAKDVIERENNKNQHNIDNQTEYNLLSGSNVLDYSKITANKRLSISDGNIVDATNQSVSEYIPVRYGQVCVLNFTLNSPSYGHIFYDANKNIVEKIASTISVLSMNVPQTAAYVRLTIPNGMLVSGSETATAYISSARFEDIEKRLISPVVKQTRWLAMGDSITFGVYSSVDEGVVDEHDGEGWVQKLAKTLNYDLTVMASKGMGYTAAVTGKDPLGGDTRINLDTLLTRTEALTADFNLITLAFGVNDYNTPSSATLDTVALGLNDALQRITTKWKNARVVVITPFNCCNTEGCTLQTKWNCNYPRGNPERTLADIADKIKECCDAFGVECINCTENFVLNVVNIAKTLDNDVRLLPDKVHPSQEAHELIAKTMAHHLIF